MDTSLRAAECPVCLEKLTEAYLCEKGHSLCRKCSVTVTECPLCRSSMTLNRNYTLEAVIKELAMASAKPSKSATASKRKKNGYYCPIFNECIVYCDNLKKLNKHLHESHKDKILVSDNVFVITLRGKQLENEELMQKILICNGNIYKLCLKMNNQNRTVIFAMQMFGHKTQRGKIFEIDYINYIRKDKYASKVTPIKNDAEAFTTSVVIIPKSHIPACQLPKSNIYKFYCQVRSVVSKKL